MKSINCKSWTPGKGPDHGICALKLFGGRPSVGTCYQLCTDRQPISGFVEVTISIPHEQRPRATGDMILAWAQAATGNRRVKPEVSKARQAICLLCDRLRIDAKGSWCSMCGCATHGEVKDIFNLTTYVEKLDPHSTVAIGGGIRLGGGYTWGCKHPKRGQPKHPNHPDGTAYGWPLPAKK